jgi:hypothetical protein
MANGRACDGSREIPRTSNVRSRSWGAGGGRVAFRPRYDEGALHETPQARPHVIASPREIL